MEIITWDLETEGLGGNVVLGGIYDGENYQEFEKIEKFIEKVREKKGKKVYAHNAGRYDNRYLLEELLKNGEKITRMMTVQSSLIFSSLGKRFLDSSLLLPRTLEELTDAFDVEEKKKKFDMEKWRKQGYPITQKLEKYLRSDVVGLYQVLEKFSKLLDGEMKTTIASTSFEALLNTSYNGEKVRDSTKNYLTKDREKFVRKSYKGGRVEVYRKEGKNLKYYDVNSLYPHVMKKYPYPYGKPIESEKGKHIRALINTGQLGIVKYWIEAPDLSIPYLGTKFDRKLVFPVGKWEDVITSFEYHQAEKRGYDLYPEKGIFYTHKGTLLTDFVDKYYHQKKKSEGAKRFIAKLMLNSAYGKFGQRRTYREIITEETAVQEEDLNCELLSQEFGLYKRDKTSYADRRINPVIATFVTAYARHELYRMMEKLGFDHIYYCDTDSLFTDVSIPSEYVHGSELGKWSLEDEAEEFVAVSNKLYGYTSKDSEVYLKLKGVPRGARLKMNLDDLRELNRGYEKKFEYEKLTGFKEHFILNRKLEGMIDKITLLKEISGEYDKREFHGEKSEPVNITEKRREKEREKAERFDRDVFEDIDLRYSIDKIGRQLFGDHFDPAMVDPSLTKEEQLTELKNKYLGKQI